MFTCHAQEYLFFGSQQTSSVYKVDLINNNVKAIDTSISLVRRLSTDTLNKKIYWVVGGLNKIVRSDYTGANKQDVLLNATNINNIKVDALNAKIYYTLANSNNIRVCDLNGGNSQILISQTLNVQGIAVDAIHNAIYWTEYNTGDIKKARLNGSNVTTIYNSSDLIFDLDINSNTGLLYFSNRTGDFVQTIDTNGLNLQTIVTAGARIGSVKLSIASNQLFWLTNETNRSQIKKSDLSGNNIQTVLDTIGFVLSGIDISEAKTLVGINESKLSFNEDVNVFPIPFTNQLYIIFKNTIEETIELRMFDIHGRAVVTEIRYVNQQIELNRGELPSGTYVLKLMSIEKNEIILTKKVIIE
jgi:hypothetical protein